MCSQTRAHARAARMADPPPPGNGRAPQREIVADQATWLGEGGGVWRRTRPPGLRDGFRSPEPSENVEKFIIPREIALPWVPNGRTIICSTESARS